MKRGNRRGVTLAELCVVMALIAIIGTTVVSFCILINAHVGRITESSRIQQEFSLVEAALDRFVSDYDREGCSFARGPDGALVVSSPSGGPRRLYFSPEERALKGDLLNGQTLSYPLPNVVRADFRVSGGRAGSLVRCRIAYLKTAAATGLRTEREEEFLKAVRAVTEP